MLFTKCIWLPYQLLLLLFYFIAVSFLLAYTIFSSFLSNFVSLASDIYVHWFRTKNVIDIIIINAIWHVWVTTSNQYRIKFAQCSMLFFSFLLLIHCSFFHLFSISVYKYIFCSSKHRRIRLTINVVLLLLCNKDWWKLKRTRQCCNYRNARNSDHENAHLLS